MLITFYGTFTAAVCRHPNLVNFDVRQIALYGSNTNMINTNVVEVHEFYNISKNQSNRSSGSRDIAGQFFDFSDFGGHLLVTKGPPGKMNAGFVFSVPKSTFSYISHLVWRVALGEVPSLVKHSLKTVSTSLHVLLWYYLFYVYNRCCIVGHIHTTLCNYVCISA